MSDVIVNKAGQYQYILLDWDGNLAKTLDVWIDGMRLALKKRGLHFSDLEIASNVGQMLVKFAEWGIQDIEQTYTETNDFVKQNLSSVALYPDALFVLNELKKIKKDLALISSSSHSHIKHLLEKYNIDGHFKAVIANDDVKNIKPHPEPLEKALDKLGGIKSKAIMIGDSAHDIQAAQNAGIDSLLFYPPEHRKFYDIDILKKHRPTYIVEDFRLVLDIVR